MTTPARCPRCHAPVLRALSAATGRPLTLDAQPAGWSGGWAVDEAGWATPSRRGGGRRAHVCGPSELPGTVPP